MAYLDDTGLAYFWGKIKAWANSVFALLGHTHSASDVTLMTGYSKPSASSAIASTDTLNQAVGKLEKGVEEVDGNVVHTTGDETVHGIKTFTFNIVRSAVSNNGLGFVVKGDSTLAFDDYANVVAFNTSSNHRRFYLRVHPEGNSDGKVLVALASLHEDANGSNFGGQIVVGLDNNDIKFATAPSTSLNRSIGNDIVTRDWIPNDTRVVHTTGSETINGAKTFTTELIIKRANPYVRFFETDITCGTGIDSNASSYAGLLWGDKNNVVMGEVIGRYYGGASDKNYFVFLHAMDCTSSTPATGSMVGAMYWGTGVASFMPEATNTVLLGGSSRRWKEVWCSQSSMNSSSDERLKEDIGSIPDEVLDAWEDVSWIQYRFKDANREKHGNARLHAGAIAQRVDEAFSGRGLDASRYGFFLHDEWEETPEARDADGNILQTYQAAGDEYGLRYVEALCMEAAYQRRENARLRVRLAALEDRLAALELRLGSE